MIHVLFAAVASVSTIDARFVREALASGSAEIAQGQNYSDDADSTVAAFAARMVADHGTANTNLLSIARKLDVTVPNSTLPGGALQSHSGGPPSPQANSPQARAAKALAPVPYFRAQIAAHEKAIALFKREIATGRNAQIVDFAKQTLPVLQTHLRLAERDLKTEKSRSG